MSEVGHFLSRVPGTSTSPAAFPGTHLCTCVLVYVRPFLLRNFAHSPILSFTVEPPYSPMTSNVSKQKIDDDGESSRAAAAAASAAQTAFMAMI